jgi:hypothetical protein
MPKHDIIDNRREKLVDHINRILSSTESARFAVGYFFLSGLENIALCPPPPRRRRHCPHAPYCTTPAQARRMVAALRQSVEEVCRFSLRRIVG